MQSLSAQTSPLEAYATTGAVTATARHYDDSAAVIVAMVVSVIIAITASVHSVVCRYRFENITV